MTAKIPQGYHTITPGLVFKDAKAAIALYKKAFGATEDYCMLVPGSDRVMHACLTVGDSKLFLSDENPGMPLRAPTGDNVSVSFYLYVANADSAHKQALANGMKETMPVSDMFWGDRVGGVQDAFGYRWTVAMKVKDLTQAELDKAAKEAHAKAA